MADENNKYTKMQQTFYDNEAKGWNLKNRDAVVGSFDEHNNWKDYDIYLFKNVNLNGKVALDFATGPGRNIVKFAQRGFKRIDGCDISEINLRNAKMYTQISNLPFVSNFYKNNGTDLSCIQGENIYDIIFSTICLQHICVYDIRFSLLKEFYRLLVPGGVFCAQMGFGNNPNKKTSKYFENSYDAQGTNSAHDVRIESVEELKEDLINRIGFKNFVYYIRPVGPGDSHPHWIFFKVEK